MISFKVLTDDNIYELSAELFPDISEKEEAVEVLSSFLPFTEEDIEVGVSRASGCILVRICDMGRYSFVYPIMMSDDSDPTDAVDEIRAYAVREEIPLLLTDVPREDIGVISLFRHARVDAEDAERESYRIKIENECSLLDGIPEYQGERITLSALREEDSSLMAALAKDGEVNKYWGYDYLSDVGEVDDGYFYRNALYELSRGQALSIAIRTDGKFIGEAIMWGFDYLGGAEVAIRLFSDWHGMGYGSESLSCLMNMAKKIGLIRLRGRADERNAPSIKMMKKFFEISDVSDGVIFFETEL